MSSSRRRLVSGSSSRRANGSRTTESAGSISLDLPHYEPPTCPLNEEGLQTLRELPNARINDQLKKHLEQSTKLLASTVYDTLEILAIRKREAANAAEREAKRRRANDHNSELDERARVAKEYVKELEQNVSPLTLWLEKSMREVLDMEAALLDEKEILEDLPRLVTEAQELFIQEAQDEDEDTDPPEIPGVPIFRILQVERDRKNALYEKLNMRAKYAQHNSYIDFRRNWNDGVCFEQNAPVPDPSTWFDDDGRPQHIVPGRFGDDPDDDIQVASENRSFRCPLSLVDITEPYTCRRCKHTFQKKAIMEYIQAGRRGAPVSCPESGCQVTVSLFSSIRGASERNDAYCRNTEHDNPRPLLRRIVVTSNQTF